MVFRYASRISSFDHSRAIFEEMTSSFILRVRVRSAPTSTFLTYCWVIVEPPPALSLPMTLSRAARTNPEIEKPGLL